MSLTFTVYHRPNGRKTEHEMTHIEPEDEAWYKENNIKVSTEQISDDNIFLYAEYGETDGEPDEITYIVPSGETCQVSMAKIRKQIEEIKTQV